MNAKKSRPRARVRVSLDRIPGLLERIAGVMSSEVERLELKATGTPAQAKSEAARPRLGVEEGKALARYMGALTGTYRDHRAEEREIEARLKEKSLAELQAMIAADGKSKPKVEA